MSMLQRLRILPLLVLVAGLALVVRTGEFATGLRHAGQAFAQQEVNAEPPPLPVKNEAEAASVTDQAVPAGESPEAAAAVGPPAQKGGIPSIPPPGKGEKIEWKDATEADFEYSAVRAELYDDLAARRKELESRERSLATREALLEAAERELDQKLREMTAVRNEIQGLLARQSQEEQDRLSSLVRIYEGMKAKDAARIFNTLDIDVLISVLSRMSERKSAPILAEMAPERARSVTILLAQQKQIPDIPPQ